MIRPEPRRDHGMRMTRPRARPARPPTSPRPRHPQPPWARQMPRGGDVRAARPPVTHARRSAHSAAAAATDRTGRAAAALFRATDCNVTDRRHPQ